MNKYKIVLLITLLVKYCNIYFSVKRCLNIIAHSTAKINNAQGEKLLEDFPNNTFT